MQHFIFIIIVVSGVVMIDTPTKPLSTRAKTTLAPRRLTYDMSEIQLRAVALSCVVVFLTDAHIAFTVSAITQTDHYFSHTEALRGLHLPFHISSS